MIYNYNLFLCRHVVLAINIYVYLIYNYNIFYVDLSFWQYFWVRIGSENVTMQKMHMNFLTFICKNINLYRLLIHFLLLLRWNMNPKWSCKMNFWNFQISVQRDSMRFWSSFRSSLSGSVSCRSPGKWCLPCSSKLCQECLWESDHFHVCVQKIQI